MRSLEVSEAHGGIQTLPSSFGRSPSARPRGFTLIELLVVVAIISLIISLLLPSLSGARRTAERVACLATMRGVGQAGSQYQDDNNGWLVGSPQTSGAYLAGATFSHGAAVQRWDFEGPLEALMGLGIPLADGSQESMKSRFSQIRDHPAFLCRSNRQLATHYPGAGSINVGTGRMVSYNTCRYMLTNVVGSGAEGAGMGEVIADSGTTKLRGGYGPKIERMGVPANKVFFADGSRYSSASSVEGIQPPSYDVAVSSPFGGTFSDSGGWAKFSNSWDRSRAPNNGFLGRTDGRIWAYRHSTGQPPVGAPGNAYQMNVVFYDGHAETQGDLVASNPHQWLPQGTLCSLQDVWIDAMLFFGLMPGPGGTGITIGP